MECPIELNGLLTKVILNSLPLGSYDVVIGMGWLENHRAKVDFYGKVLECVDDGRMMRVAKGILKQASVSHISALQLRKF